jgi:thiamine biosynthesis lipoprotein
MIPSRTGAVGHVALRALRVFVVVYVASLTAACARRTADDSAKPASAHAPHIVARSGLAMGSSLTLTAWTADEDTAGRAFDAVFHEFDRLDQLMSVWKEGSDIVRLNGAAGEHPVHVSPETAEVLTLARSMSELTSGKFDVTFGALSDIWKFDQDQDDSVPPQAAIAARLPLIDYRRLIVDPQNVTAFLEKKGMRAHLGGIGKGYAVDRGVALLRRAGLNDFSIQAGGDLYVSGRRGDRPWRLGIADPRAPDGAIFARIELSNSTFSTSGDYERAFVKDGVRYHHILDPATGQPGRLCRSVTILAKTGVLAEGLSKGVFLLGPDQGLALVEQSGADAVVVDADNQVQVSKGLKDKLEILHQPTDGI